jgi:hypothetical protein
LVLSSHFQLPWRSSSADGKQPRIVSAKPIHVEDADETALLFSRWGDVIEKLGNEKATQPPPLRATAFSHALSIRDSGKGKYQVFQRTEF